MKHPKHRRFLSLWLFLLSFFFAFLILSLFAAPALVRAAEEEKPSPAAYEPDWEDRLSVLCAVRSEQGAYRRFFLLRLEPFDRILYVAPLPAELSAAAGDRQNTLRGFAGYGGVSLCAEALRQTYGLSVDRTLSMTGMQLRDLVNRAGGVRFVLGRGYDCIDPDSGARRSYLAGDRRLDGAAFVDLLLNAETDTRLEGVLFSGQLAAGLFNCCLRPRETENENGLQPLIDYMSTDLSYADYFSRADALDDIAIHGRAEPVLVGGSYTGDADFVFSEQALETLQGIFAD